MLPQTVVTLKHWDAYSLEDADGYTRHNVRFILLLLNVHFSRDSLEVAVRSSTPLSTTLLLWTRTGLRFACLWNKARPRGSCAVTMPLTGSRRALIRC